MNRILLGELIDLQKAASHHYITEQCLMPTRTHERNRWEETTVKMKKMRLLQNKTPRKDGTGASQDSHLLSTVKTLGQNL